VNGKRLVLDTTIIIDQFRKGDKTEKLLSYEVLDVPLVVVAELYYGAHKSGRFEKKQPEINSFLELVNVVEPTLQTAQEFGRVKAQLASKGTLIPDHDIWIAAAALEAGVEVATRDGHFQQIEGLAVISF
jgi:tRNA(fMet)-specific endonuclease VapC